MQTWYFNVCCYEYFLVKHKINGNICKHFSQPLYTARDHPIFSWYGQLNFDLEGHRNALFKKGTFWRQFIIHNDLSFWDRFIVLALIWQEIVSDTHKGFLVGMNCSKKQEISNFTLRDLEIVRDVLWEKSCKSILMKQGNYEFVAKITFQTHVKI